MATKRKVKHVVADSGAFIRNAPLREIGEQVYTLPDVVAEIKDKATKQRLQFLPYSLEYREPSPESVKIVTEFSKKTGDYPSLSATDIKVLALAYHLEKEHVGTKHIKTTPDTKIEINLASKAPSEPTQIAGFYLGTQKRSDSESSSGSTDNDVNVDEVTSALENQSLAEAPLDKETRVVSTQNSQDLNSSRPVGDIHNHVVESRDLSSDDLWKTAIPGVQKIYSETREDFDSSGNDCKLDDEEEFPSLACTSRQVDILDSDNVLSLVSDVQIDNNEVLENRHAEEYRDLLSHDMWKTALPGVQKIYSESRNDFASGGHDNKLDDEEEFPALGFVPQDADIEENRDLSSHDMWKTAIPGVQNIFSETRDDFASGGHDNKLADKEEFPSLGSMAPEADITDSNVESSGQLGTDHKTESIMEDLEKDFPSLSVSSQPPWGCRQVHIEVKDESGIEDESDSLALDSEDYPALSQGAPAEKQKQLVSYASMLLEGKARVQPAPVVKRVFHEGQILPSSFIGEDQESDEEEEVDEGIEEFDDGDGWITPSNIKNVKKQMGLEGSEKADAVVGCLTTDFAMQNVLIQMGLNVISVDGMLIKKAKSYVLRCFACFKVTSNMEKQFCPHCGNHTLKRIAMTVNDDGTVKYFFSRRKQLTARGLRQSLPAPKGGKRATNPVLVADQPMPHQRPSRKAMQSMDVFDPDFVASESPFSKRDVSSRAAQIGIMRRGQAGGHRHQARGKKSSGKRK